MHSVTVQRRKRGIMTYREKIQEEHPECIDSNELGGVRDCPADYDYEDGIYCHKVGDDCEACWNRDIPGTESTRDYKVGDKFVLAIQEIDDLKNHIVLEGIAVGTDMLDKLERLDSDYVNEYFGELQDEAHAQGFREGAEDALKWSKASADEFYQQGLNDAWELAKRIASSEENGGIDIATQTDIFGVYMVGVILREHTYQEALAKIEAYENAKKAEIKVGDIVHVKSKNIELIVTRVDTEHRGIYGMNKAGMSQWEDMDNLTKTDRFTEIQGLLDDLD